MSGDIDTDLDLAFFVDCTPVFLVFALDVAIVSKQPLDDCFSHSSCFQLMT